MCSLKQTQLKILKLISTIGKISNTVLIGKHEIILSEEFGPSEKLEASSAYQDNYCLQKMSGRHCQAFSGFKYDEKFKFLCVCIYHFPNLWFNSLFLI